MSGPGYIEDCLERRLILFTGKGGVGKSSLAWATALACQRRGMNVAVAAWKSVQPFPAPPSVERVDLETTAAFREYVVSVVRFEKVYDVVFDNPVLSTFVAAAPGLSDTVIGGKIWDLWDRKVYDLLIVDLPASGHAYQFFQSPHGVKKVFSMGVVHRNLMRILDMFRDPSARLDLVTLPEELPITETLELKEKLERLHPFSFGFVHVNRMLPDFALESPLPPSVEPWCRGFEAQRLREQENVTSLRALDMPGLRHPRLATESGRETVEGLARSFEEERTL